MTISERIRPGIEAADWVCVEVGKLEVSYAAVQQQLAECQAKVQKYRGDIASYIAMEHGEDAAANYLAKELE